MMAPRVLRLALLTVSSQWAALVRIAGASAVNFRGSAVVPVKAWEAKETLLKEMMDDDRHLAPLEEQLRPMYLSLPKNAHGNLAHQTVRFALHRFFVKRHGWYLRGLDVAISAAPPPVLLLDGKQQQQMNRTAPDFLQETLEAGMGEEGADLHGLAALAASLEDLVQNEVKHQLKLAYQAEDLSTLQSTSKQQVQDALWTYFVNFLLENNWTVSSRLDLDFKKMLFEVRHAGQKEAKAWFQNVTERFLPSTQETDTSFDAAAAAAHEITKEYHSVNDADCKDLRATLQSMESQRPGRVRLSVFYNKSLYTRWLFAEKESVLKAMGTLDDSTEQPHVIIPNYVISRPNCLKSSSLYAICCRNTCEDLMTALEKDIGSPTAAPTRIAELVAGLSSDMIQAPRGLPEVLVKRLGEIAERHDGEVPLHGRLFAQWMHHAYPLECPYPQAGGVVDPQTIDTWLQEAAGQVTAEEIKERVEADTCALKWEGAECGEESAEVQWSGEEHLLGGAVAQQKPQKNSVEKRWLLLVLALAAILAVTASRTNAIMGGNEKQLQFQLAALLLAVVAYSAGLLNGKVFAVSMVGSCAAKLFSVYQHRMTKERFMLPKVV